MQSRILTSCRGIRRRFGSTTATTSSSAGYFLPKTVSPAYGAAVDFLETQRQLIKKKLDEAQKDLASKGDVKSPSSRVQELQIQLALTEPKTHKAYADGEGDLSDPVYAKLHHNRWTNHVVPRLLKSSQELKIVGDMVPEAVQPTVNLELNFPNTKWWGAYGHAVPPNWALYSPSMTIITNDTTRRYFTLAMVDLDYPDLETKSYKEYCHWLVTNIPVQGKLEIPGGSSPFLGPPNASSENTEDSKGVHYVPSAPQTPPSLPGQVLLDYVPPHPPMSNPRKLHRYVLALLESNKGPGSLLDLKENGNAQKADDVLQSKTRLSLGPLYKLMEDSGATLAGYGFFTSSWNVHTPDIFTRLNIHEPVYGTTKLKATTTPQELIKSLESARDLAAALPGHLSTQSRASLEFLNEGRKPLTGVQVRHSAARIYREEQQQDQRKKGNTNQSYSNASRRVPRMTALGVAGLVKAKSGDIASVTQGPITRRVKSVTNPYKNI